MTADERSVSQIVELTGATTGAYGTGQVIGTLMTFDNLARLNSPGGLITNVMLVEFASQQNSQIDVFIFNRSIPIGANKTTLAIGVNDVPAIVGIVSIVATDYVALGGGSVASKSPVAIAYRLPPDNNTGQLYAALVSRGTPNYPAPKLSLRIGVLQD